MVLAVYNGQTTIRRAIHSVLRQSLRTWELVIVDDGSTDGTKKVLRSLQDDRIRVIEFEENQGFVAALNAGLCAARGDLVARLDADDVLYEKCLQTYSNEFGRDPQLVLFGARARCRRTGGECCGTMGVAGSHRATVRFLYRDNPFVHSVVCFRRAMVVEAGGYASAFSADPDYELWIRLAARGTVSVSSAILGEHFVSPDSMSRGRSAHAAYVSRLRCQVRAHQVHGPRVSAMPWLAWTAAKAAITALLGD